MNKKPLHDAKIHAVVLAAGKGTRMKSDLPKVLHTLGEVPLLIHVISSAISAGISNVSIVVGHEKEKVQNKVDSWAKSIQDEIHVFYPVQEPQNGTGHAVLATENTIPKDTKFVLVLLGDVPLLQSETIVMAYEQLLSSNASAVVITTELDDATGYGRVIRNENDLALEIVEHKDATEQQKSIKEINTGIFLFKNEHFFDRLNKIGTDNKQGEVYLTDMVKILNREKETVSILKVQEPIQFKGINSKEDLDSLSKIYVPLLRGKK